MAKPEGEAIEALMKTVWVVEQGEYSDYRVVGVFTSKENAEKVRAMFSEDDTTEYGKATVAEWNLDPSIEQLNAGLRQFELWIDREGNAYHPPELVEPFDVDLRDDFKAIDTWNKDTQKFDAPRHLRCEVWAKDEEHAIKIANERRTQLIATGQWDTAIHGEAIEAAKGD